MKRFIICLIFPLWFFACDGESNMAQSLLALQSNQSPVVEKQQYKMFGGYFDLNNNLATFQLGGNFLPKKYNGFNVTWFLLAFDVALKEEFNLNLNINDDPAEAFLFICDYKVIGIELTHFGGDNFVISGTVEDYNGNTITIETPVITYK